MATLEIPGFEIYELIGRGGMASVYRALHLNLDREVAIKVMKMSSQSDDMASERFIREARISARLIHPHILQIYDVNSHGSMNYISMELLGGGDLGDNIRGALTQRTIYDVMSQMTSALDYSASKGYVHRDIKPSNILLRGDSDYVLADFGIAKAARSTTLMTQTGLLVGTPSYMSPEQARGAEIDGRSDLYSLAILCYEMLTKERPYDSDSAISTAVKHLTEQVPSLTGNLSVYQPFFDKAMAKEADDRYQTGREMFEAFCSVRGHFGDDEVLTPAGSPESQQGTVALEAHDLPTSTSGGGAYPPPTSIAWDEPTRVVTPPRSSGPVKPAASEPLLSGIHSERREMEERRPAGNAGLFSIVALVMAGGLAWGGYVYWQERPSAEVGEVSESLAAEPVVAEEPLSNAQMRSASVDLAEQPAEPEGAVEAPVTSVETVAPDAAHSLTDAAQGTGLSPVNHVEDRDNDAPQESRVEEVGQRLPDSNEEAERLAQRLADALLHYENGEYGSAAEQYSAIEESNPNSPAAKEGLDKSLAALVKQARYYVESGNFATARSNLSTAEQLAPGYGPGEKLLAELLTLEALQEQQVKENRRAGERAEVAVEALRAGNLDLAVATYEQLALDHPALDATISLKNQILTAYARATRDEIANEEYDAAEETLSRGRLLSPDYAVWNELEEELSLSRYSQRRRLGPY